MTRSPSSRRKGTQGTFVLVLFAASILGHAAVIAVVQVDTPMMNAVLARPADARRAATAREMVLSCEGDVALATAARVGMCATPFAGISDVEACTRDAGKQLEMDLIRCRQDPDAVGIELVNLSEVDMTPRPLMPDVKPVDDVVAAELIEKEIADKVEQAQKEIQRPNVNGQIVEIARPQVEIAPDKARYLSEYDSRTDKQTVARGSTEEMVAKPAPKMLPPTADKNPLDPDPTARPPKETAIASQTPGKGSSTGQGAAPTTLAMRGPGSAAESPAVERTKPGEKSGELVATADGIAAKRGESGDLSRATELEPPGGAEGGGGPEKAPNLRPSEELLERAVGGGSVDHLEDAEEGEFTSLNSRKWKYATFFNRMKRQVAQNWHPDVVYLRRDPNGNIYGNRDRLTVLRVSLKPNGSVAKIYVAKRSGVDFLDDEAVRAFEEAQPFPNPPAGLVDARSNMITFSFGFHFQIGGDRSNWKVFRYQ